MSWNVRVAVVLLVLAVSAVPALAQGPVPPGARAAVADLKQAEVAMGGGYNAAMAASGDEIVVGAWSWYLQLQTWTYPNTYFSSGYGLWAQDYYTNDTFWVDAKHPLADQMRNAMASSHWLALYWDTATTWTDAIVYYY